MEKNLEQLNYKLKIVDDFLNESDFKRLCNLKINKNVEKDFQSP